MKALKDDLYGVVPSNFYPARFYFHRSVLRQTSDKAAALAPEESQVLCS